MEKETLLRLLQVSKAFSGKRVLDALTLSIYAKETVAIVGANGSGKSTLLRLISGLSPVTKGSREVTAEQLMIGYAPDRFPKLRFTPTEYLWNMGRIQGVPVEELNRRIEGALRRFSMDHAAGQRMTGFSKGMLQKVNIMQALLKRPDLLLLDEPLSGLDLDSQREFIAMFQDLKRDGIAITMSSHEPLLIQTVADRIVTLDRGGVVSDVRMRDRHVDVVVIQVRLESFPDTSALDGHPAVLHREKQAGVTTLHVHSDGSDKILRTLLEMNGSIVSLNSVTSNDDVRHFRGDPVGL